MSDKVLGGVFYMGLNWGVALESLEFLSWRKHCSVQPYQVHFVTESQDFALIYSLSPVVTKQSISNALFPRWAHHGDTARSAKSIECISQYKNIVGHSWADKNIKEQTPNPVLDVLRSQNDRLDSTRSIFATGGTATLAVWSAWCTRLKIISICLN